MVGNFIFMDGMYEWHITAHMIIMNMDGMFGKEGNFIFIDTYSVANLDRSEPSAYVEMCFRRFHFISFV